MMTRGEGQTSTAGGAGSCLQRQGRVAGWPGVEESRRRRKQ